MTFENAKSHYFNLLCEALKSNNKESNEIIEYLSIISPNNIEIAHKLARRGKGDYGDVIAVNSDDSMIADIYELLIRNTYEVSPYKISKIYDPKERILLKLPYYPDRIIQWVIMQYLEPILMKHYHTHSCASIKGRGIDTALNIAKAATQELQFPKEFYKYKRYRQGDFRHSHCLKIDAKHFYQSINHDILKKKLQDLSINKYILNLIYKIIDSTNPIPSEKSGLKPGVGLPIGSYLSQHLANLYLTDIDNFLSKLPNSNFVRYMDDILVFWDSHYCHELRKVLVEKFADLKLEMRQNWQVYNLSKEGIDFVGYRIYRTDIKMRSSTKKRMIKKLNKRNKASYFGIVKRTGNMKFLKKYFGDFQDLQNLSKDDMCKVSNF